MNIFISTSTRLVKYLEHSITRLRFKCHFFPNMIMLTTFRAAYIITSILSAALADNKGGIATKCETCTDIVNNINEGIKKTSKSNFGGGNTKWEEKNLGSYSVSETRLLEILENVCKDNKQCHQMLEEHEETLEHWWFNVYPKEKNEDLHSYFCINKLKVCCPSGTYGPNCEECTGGKDNPCRGNGRCQGNGTRSGTGNCDCSPGYTGKFCESCTDTYYEESKNDTHTICKACHKACKRSCRGPGPEHCDDCKEGWILKDGGCQDVNECDDDPCEEDEFCSNTPGSYHCQACHEACSGCTGPTASDCEECNEGYYLDDKTCKACHVSCADSCTGGSDGDCNRCKEGWAMDSEGRCHDINECTHDPSPCDKDSHCINTEGSYRCSTCHYACDGCTGSGADKCIKCKTGYIKDSSGMCTDDDECDREDICPGKNKLCINTPGSYKCDCNPGFTLVDGDCVEKSKKKKTSDQKNKNKTQKKKQKVAASDSADGKFPPIPDMKEIAAENDDMIVMEGNFEDKQQPEENSQRDNINKDEL